MLDVRQQLSEPGQAGQLDAGDAALAVRQLSFRELTYRRFMAHPAARWAALGLGIIVVACYGAPLWHALFPGFVQSPTDFTLTQANQGPSLRHPFGTDSLL